MGYPNEYRSRSRSVRDCALRSLLIVLFLLQVTAPMPAHTQEKPTTVLSGPCLQLISPRMMYENKAVAQIKLDAKVLDKASDGALLLLVSPDCLAKATKDPVDPDPVAGKKDEASTPPSPADVQDVINRVAEDSARDGEQAEAVRRGADGIRKFVQRQPHGTDLTQSLADTASDLISKNPSAAAVAAIAAACLAMSGGVACTLPVALGQLFKLFENTSTEDFQAGIRALTKLATGKPLSENDYVLIGNKAPPEWLPRGLEAISSGSVESYLRHVADQGASSRKLQQNEAEAIRRLGALVQKQPRLTCEDVVKTVRDANRVKIHVSVETRRAIHAAVFSKPRNRTRETLSGLRRCLNDAFPAE